jgi:hypothetical protein
VAQFARFGGDPAWAEIFLFAPSESVTDRHIGDGQSTSRRWHANLCSCLAAHSDLDVADDSVVALANELVNTFNSVAGGYAPLPSFNEVTWTLYPRDKGHITAHRDPPAFTGVVTVATLAGSARFRVSNGTDHDEWETASGDVVVLGAHGWPSVPVHEVDPPTDGDRMIMTLRHNSRGPGGGYDVGPTEHRRIWPPDRKPKPALWRQGQKRSVVTRYRRTVRSCLAMRLTNLRKLYVP